MDEQAIGRSPLEAFAAVPDPRKRRGRRQSPTVVQALGFTRERTPCVATLHLAFKALDAPVFKAALARWAQGQLGDGWEAVALDGKALRGIHGEELPGVRLVAACFDWAGLVLAQSGGPDQRA